MPKKLKILEIAHNKIISDSRVRKYVRSLGGKGKGHEVHILGVNTTEENYHLDEGQESFKLINFLPLRKKAITIVKSSFAISLIFALSLIVILFGYNLFTAIYNHVIYFIPIAMLFLLLMYKKIESLRRLLVSFINPFKKLLSLIVYIKSFADELKYYENKDFDVIHVHDHIALLPVLLRKKRFRKAKVIWDAHELYFDSKTTGLLVSIYVNSLLKFFGTHIDEVFTINDSFKEIYQKKFFKSQPISVIKNATNFVSLPKLVKPNTINEQLGTSKKILLFQGGLSPKRGIEKLIQAASYINNDWIIVFMGSGKIVEKVKEAQKKNNNIKHIEPVDKDVLQLWTSSADLGIIPYENTSLNHYYCTPNKLWEFMNSGLPFIATGLKEIEKFEQSFNVSFLLPINFTAEKIANMVNSISKNEIDLKRKNAINHASNENWQKYERIFIKRFETI